MTEPVEYWDLKARTVTSNPKPFPPHMTSENSWLSGEQKRDVQWFHFWAYNQDMGSRVSVSYLCTHIYDSIICNAPKVGATQLFFDGWMDKQNVE